MPKVMGILGKKVGMTRVYTDDGAAVGVTVIEAGPCVVLQKKTVAKDGYSAIQVGFAPKRASRLSKPMAGHVKAAGQEGGYYHLKEFRVDDPGQYELGQQILLADLVKVGDIVDISGFSKGRGFQGVVKRHGFKGGGATHGSMFHRRPGSIGCSAWPSRVVKGKKLPGRMGNERITKKNAIVIDVRPEQNVLLVKGPVPGSAATVLQIFTK